MTLSNSLVTLLVGAHFHPPAKTLLEHLPSGTLLELVPEPWNPYDESAVQVFLAPEAIPETEHAELADLLPASGFDLQEMLSSEQLVALGHLASSSGKPLLQARKTDEGLVGNLEFLQVFASGVSWQAELVFRGDGKPAVRLSFAKAVA